MTKPTERPKPKSLQAEPPYPGLETVIHSLRSPDWTAHLATELCPTECPHPVSACGEFKEEK